MKKILVAAVVAAAFCGAPALAADMPVKAPPPPVATPAYNWTGFYVGGNAGYGWADRTASFSPNDVNSAFLFDGDLGSTPPGPASFGVGGGFGGLQAGYNWQLNQKWLLGVEADFDGAGIDGKGQDATFLIFPLAATPSSGNIQASQDIKWFGTIRGRLGVLPANNTLVYATGGFAYGHVTEQQNLNGGSSSFGPTFGWFCSGTGAITPNCFSGNSSRNAFGWTLGGGVEYAPWNNNITVKVEYLYINLGGGDAVNVVAQNGDGFTPSSITASYSRTDLNVIRGGVNYKF
jgi:outer membrane immunogenic protein